MDDMEISGLDTGLSGLVTLIREPFLRPVHIVRQTIPNPETGNSRYAAYHENKGLSSMPQNRRESRRTTHIPGRITNPIVGYAGLADMLDTLVWKIKGFVVFLFSNAAPCKSVLKNQKYKIVKGAI